MLEYVGYALLGLAMVGGLLYSQCPPRQRIRPKQNLSTPSNEDTTPGARRVIPIQRGGAAANP